MNKLYTSETIQAAAAKKLAHIGTVVAINVITKRIVLVKHNVLWEGQEFASLSFGVNENGVGFHTGHYDISKQTAFENLNGK